jgi:protein-disulfide isomerase
MSGKQSKRRRRSQRIETQARPPRRASPKVLLAGLLVLAFVGVGVAVVSSLGGTSAPRPVSGVAKTRGLFHDLPQRENVLGAAAAPVTVVEYADLQCPFCRDFELRWAPALVERYVRNGTAKVVFRPLAFIGFDSVRGRQAVIAAGLQGKLFEAVQLLYANQRAENTGWLDERLVESVGRAIPGLDVQRFLADIKDAGVARRAQLYDSAAKADQISLTPTLLVGKSGGRLRPVDPAQLAAAIESAAR